MLPAILEIRMKAKMHATGGIETLGSMCKTWETGPVFARGTMRIPRYKSRDPSRRQIWERWETEIVEPGRCESGDVPTALT